MIELGVGALVFVVTAILVATALPETASSWPAWRRGFESGGGHGRIWWDANVNVRREDSGYVGKAHHRLRMSRMSAIQRASVWSG